MTVADQIRALAAQGLSRADIARRLGKSYQHVRNVLEGDRARSIRGSPPSDTPPERPGVFEPPATFAKTYRLNLEEGGVLRLPEEVMDALGVRTGSIVICEVDDDRLLVLGARAAWRRIDELMAPFRKPGQPLVSEELIAERRAEAERENDG